MTSVCVAAFEVKPSAELVLLDPISDTTVLEDVSSSCSRSDNSVSVPFPLKSFAFFVLVLAPFLILAFYVFSKMPSLYLLV